MSEMVDRVLEIMQSRGLMADENDARAVIEEMREPTEAMMRAANRPYLDDDDRDLFDKNTALTWDGMIDAVLKTA